MKTCEKTLALPERQLEVLSLALGTARVTMPESLHELARRCRNCASALSKSGRRDEARFLEDAGELIVTFLHHSLPIDSLIKTVLELVNTLKADRRKFQTSIWESRLEDLQSRLATITTDNSAYAHRNNSQAHDSSRIDASHKQASEEAVQSQHVSAFIAEADQQLDEIEVCLCSLASGYRTTRTIECLFRHLHALKGLAGFVGNAEIARVTHASEEVVQLLRDGQRQLSDESLAAMFNTHDWIREQIRSLRESVENDDQPAVTKTAEQPNSQILDLIACCVPNVEPTKSIPQCESSEVKPIRLIPAAAANDVRSSAPIATAGASPTRTTGNNIPKSDAGRSDAASTSIKVDRTKLDELIELIGELSLTQSMLEEEWATTVSPSIAASSKVLQKLKKLSRELQIRSTSLRAVPIDGLFRRMSRVVFDLSRKINKPAELVIEGGETGIDKTIVDQVADPLMHLIRNSMDHGIETSSEERRNAGKSLQARITLRAYQQNGFVFVEVEDDGRGLNRNRIRQKALERGLITADRQLADDEICRLIFHPGFSTADKLTEISGRGVGMDVVKQNIEALNGSVDIRSQEGRGTTVSLRLPLTLAILDSLVVRVGSERLIIPIARVHETAALADADFERIRQTGMILRRGMELSCLDLGQRLGIKRATEQHGILIVVESHHRSLGLIVDEVVGRQTVTQRPLRNEFPMQACISGAAIMADGRVSLILDLESMDFEVA